jgi:hypothetical protein
MTSLRTILQLPRGWQIIRHANCLYGLNLILRTTRKSANYPGSSTRSSAMHSCRKRRIQHLNKNPLSIQLFSFRGQKINYKSIYYLFKLKSDDHNHSFMISSESVNLCSKIINTLW